MTHLSSDYQYEQAIVILEIICIICMKPRGDQRFWTVFHDLNLYFTRN